MSLILTELPSTEEFYAKYWNKKAFVVKAMIDENILENLIDQDHLAGLAMEEDIKSRIVLKGENENQWDCHHGPFDEQDFEELGDDNWSLLVQNIDQYHEGTSALLKAFNFTPRWLIDDIMVSFSPKGGTVGAHIDSYHVFLIQGKGSRRWKIGTAPITVEHYLPNIPLKILANDYEGEEVTVEKGDVIYIPPRFAHEGVSLSPSLTYSVGYLGPSLSELICEFGQYIEQNDALNDRYLGGSITAKSSGFMIDSAEVKQISSAIQATLNSDHFSTWLCEYFALGTPPEMEDEMEMAYMPSYLRSLADEGAEVCKPCGQKMTFIPNAQSKSYHVQMGAVQFNLSFDDLPLLHLMASENNFPLRDFANHMDLLQELLSEKIIFIAE